MTDVTAYREFITAKSAAMPLSGIEVAREDINPMLFGFQRDLTRWALRKGRAGIFADTGLGKTFIEVEAARLVNEPTLMIAPLSVAKQTVKEASKLGVEVVYARSQAEAGPITITNYEMADKFDARKFGLVELDESSMLSAVEGVRRNMLIKKFSQVPYRFCFTATPARNDIQDIVSHAEFLGVMKRRDVLATFFLHDASDARATGWRLKNHAREAFWHWMASWGMSLRKPSDLGYSDEGFVLPPLEIAPVIVDGEYTAPGRLFADRLKGIVERSAVRRQTKAARVLAACEILAREKSSAIAWVGLNDEGRDIAAELGSRAILIEGAMSPEEKEERLDSFIASDSAVLVTKTRIAGYGMNFQHCWRMAFVGLGDSYEQYYQAIRRCWRFGQKHAVKAHVVLSDIEKVIYNNVLRKEREAEEATAELVRHVAAYERAEIGRIDMGLKYDAAVDMRLPAWMGATA